MLNELLQAANAIPSLPHTLHKSLKALPKTPGYKIFIDARGKISEVQPWWEDVSQLRKWQYGSYGHTTPIFNTLPLYPLCDPNLDKDSAKAAAKRAASEYDSARRGDTLTWGKYFEAIRARCASIPGSWLDKESGSFNEKCRRSLSDVPNRLLTLLWDDNEYAVLRTLLQRLQRLTPERFFLELTQRLESQLETGYDESLFKLYCAISQSEAKKPCNLLLDIPDWNEIGEYPVTSARTAELLHDLLVGYTGTSLSQTDRETDELDAYGFPATGAKGKLPIVKVDGIGNISLRAMTKDAKCQKRYGKIEEESFIVGEDSQYRAKSALEYLTQSKRKGKTWQHQGGSLFLFYPEMESPALADMEIADICSLPDDGDDEFAEQATAAASFDARTERIAAALDGLPRESETLVHLLVLRKPDGHRTKLVAHRTFTMQGFVDAARKWVTGVKTCPPVAFSRWGKAKGARNDITPVQPFPYQVASWLNTFWVRGDEEQGRLSTFSPEDALALLLATDGTERQLAQRALRHALAGWSGFLIAAGAREHASVVLKAVDKHAVPLANLPAILSLLLFKSDSRTTQGGTMASPAFLVGRLLALADSLHLQYCEGVRNGSIPGQLLGNALVATALESPESALALYAQRILPYQAWARTCKASGNGPEALAKYFLAQLADTCAEISRHDVPQRTNDTDKAQLILGYLAKSTSEPQG